MDKFGFGKLLGSGGSNTNGSGSVDDRTPLIAADNDKNGVSVNGKKEEDRDEKDKDTKEETDKDTGGKKAKSRRKTLSLMVEPISRYVYLRIWSVVHSGLLLLTLATGRSRTAQVRIVPSLSNPISPVATRETFRISSSHLPHLQLQSLALPMAA